MSPSPATLTTEGYLQMQQEPHQNPDYGLTSAQYALLVGQVMNAVGATESLDYFAGLHICRVYRLSQTAIG